MKTITTITSTRDFDNRARLVILNEVLDCFQQVIQWDKFSFETKDSVVEYQHKAQVLIELLEVDDCGSVGGYDRENPVKYETRNKLFNRFLTVIRKYNTVKDVEQKYITVKQCETYFK